MKEDDDDEVLTPDNPFYEKTNIREVDEKKVFTKVYQRRWIMLALFVFYAALVCGQWIEYSIIANVVMRYLFHLTNPNKLLNFSINNDDFS